MSITVRSQQPHQGREIQEKDIPTGIAFVNFVDEEPDSYTVWVKLAPKHYATFYVHPAAEKVETGYLQFGGTSVFAWYREVDLVLEVSE